MHKLAIYLITCMCVGFCHTNGSSLQVVSRTIYSEVNAQHKDRVMDPVTDYIMSPYVSLLLTIHVITITVDHDGVNEVLL